MATNNNSSRLLIDEYPLQVLPSLACRIGLNEAIVLQQTHYWIGINMKRGDTLHFHDGQWWVYNSAREWKENNFPFWSEDVIYRAFNSLEERGIVRTAFLAKQKWDRRKWHTINYDALNELLKDDGAPTPTPEDNSDHSAPVRNASTQKKVVNQRKTTPSLTETTSETTTDIFAANAACNTLEAKGDETIGTDDPQPRPEPKPTPPTTTPSKKQATRGRRAIQTEPLVFPVPPSAPPPSPEQAAADLAAFNAIEGASGRELPPPTGTSKDAIERAILDKCYGNDKDLRAAGLGEARKWARHIRDLNASLETPITAELIYTVYSAPDGSYYKSFMSQNGNGGRKPPTPGIIGKHTLNILHAAEQVYKPERIQRADVPLPFGMEIAADLASLFR